jgi:FkbM family methyltransferase
VVYGLKAKNLAHPNRHYYWTALGDEEGERELFFNAADPFSSSLYRHGTDSYAVTGQRRDEARRVPIRRLDSYVDSGAIPHADVLKVDVEGFEKSVLLGARKLMSSGLLALVVETNFGANPEYRQTHFGTLLQIASEHGLRLFDLNFSRIPTAAFQEALDQYGIRRVSNHFSVGKICTVDALFCRDFVAERDAPETYASAPSSAGAEKILKMMMILESYGLNDIAVDVARRFRTELVPHMDVDEGIRLLADPNCRIDEAVDTLLRSGSWTSRAPLTMGSHLLQAVSRRLRRAWF